MCSGFILAAVTGNEVWGDVRNDFLGHFVLNWFSVGSLLCLLTPVTTITTRYTRLSGYSLNYGVR